MPQSQPHLNDTLTRQGFYDTSRQACVYNAPGLRAPILDQSPYTENSDIFEHTRKAATFLVGLPCMVSLPLCLHRACPCSTLADTHWVQIQTQIHEWVGVWRYVMTKIEELEGGDCVCLLKLVRPHRAASQYQSPHTRLFIPDFSCQTFQNRLFKTDFSYQTFHTRLCVFAQTSPPQQIVLSLPITVYQTFHIRLFIADFSEQACHTRLFIPDFSYHIVCVCSN